MEAAEKAGWDPEKRVVSKPEGKLATAHHR